MEEEDFLNGHHQSLNPVISEEGFYTNEEENLVFSPYAQAISGRSRVQQEDLTFSPGHHLQQSSSKNTDALPTNEEFIAFQREPTYPVMLNIPSTTTPVSLHNPGRLIIVENSDLKQSYSPSPSRK